MKGVLKIANVFSYLLVRVPLLTCNSVSCDCFRDVRVLLRKSRRITSEIHSKSAVTISAIERAVPLAHGRHRGALLRIKRALYNKRIPSLRDTETLGEASLYDPETILNRLFKLVKEQSDLDRTAETSFQSALRRADRDTMAHLAHLSVRQALSLSNPSVLEQAIRCVAHAPEASRPLRRTARTLRRLLWRAAARPTPLGLYASTGIANLCDGNNRSVAPLRRLITCMLRPETAKTITAEADINLEFSTYIDLRMLERKFWEQAFKRPKLIPLACTVSQWKEASDGINAGEIPSTLSDSVVRALFIESSLTDIVELPAEKLAPALDVVARLGSALVIANDESGSVQLRQVFEDWYGKNSTVPFDVFSAKLRTHLHANPASLDDDIVGLREALFNHPPNPIPFQLREIVARSFVDGAPDVFLSEESLSAIALPLSIARRACLRFRHSGYVNDKWVISIRHWGGDRMSFIPRYTMLPGQQFEALAQDFATWMTRWPEQTDIDPGLNIAVERRPPTTGIIRLDNACPSGRAICTADLRITAQQRGSNLTIYDAQTGQNIDPVYLGVLAENALPFDARLLLAISRPEPTALESIMVAINEQISMKIAEAQYEAVVLPRVRLGAYLELMPFSVFLTDKVLCTAEPDSIASCRMVWELLETIGCPCGLTEIRFVDILQEPVVLDLGHPDGVAWLIDLVRKRGAVLIVPLASWVPLNIDGPYFADLCCELCATR
jgi:hypothetical protein